VERLVSIIIINHNYAAYLATAINSALAQDYTAIEVVVVDDGSTDGSRELLAAYAGRVQVVLCEQGGHAKAANAGYLQAKGDYLLFLDADDFLYAQAVSVALAAMQDGDAKVQFRLDTVDAQGRDRHMSFPYFPPDFSPEQVEKQVCLTGWYPWTVSSGNLFARSFLQQVMPLDAARIYRSPDGYLNNIAPLFGPVRSLRQVLGAYRVHGANAWASTSQSWSVDVALRSLCFDAVVEAAFIETAAARGIALRQPLLRPLQKLEYHMLAARFATREALARLPDGGQGRFAVLAQGWRWLWHMRARASVADAARLGWLAVLAFSPRWLGRRLVTRARAQVNRGALWRHVLTLIR
jgi:hypothetical protein